MGDRNIWLFFLSHPYKRFKMTPKNPDPTRTTNPGNCCTNFSENNQPKLPKTTKHNSYLTPEPEPTPQPKSPLHASLKRPLQVLCHFLILLNDFMVDPLTVTIISPLLFTPRTGFKRTLEPTHQSHKFIILIFSKRIRSVPLLPKILFLLDQFFLKLRLIFSGPTSWLLWFGLDIFFPLFLGGFFFHPKVFPRKFLPLWLLGRIVVIRVKNF